MTDFDASIASARRRAERVRTHDLPQLADTLYSVAADWASAKWEEIIRRAIADQPEVAKANKALLADLKAALASLRATAKDTARQHLRPLVLHEVNTDEQLASYVGTTSSWQEQPRVSLPRGSSSIGAGDQMRWLVGAIGPALANAGLLDGERSEVDDAGRYRIALNIPPEVNEALNAYEKSLKELILHLHEVKSLEQQKAQAEAAALWDDA